MSFARAPAGTAVRAWHFRTRQDADPSDFVRTFGAAVELGEGRLRFTEEEAIEHAPPQAPPGCARGKVAAVATQGGQGEVACYQISDARTQARLVACCNATAAAAALLGRAADRCDVRLRVALPADRHAQVEAHIAWARDGAAARVRQTWSGVRFAVQRVARVAAGPCAVIAGPLNDYLVVLDERGHDGPAPRWTDLDAEADPLRSRLAVLRAREHGAPSARFFTCGQRAHPSAPLTGLAVLALAARRLSWLGLAGAGGVTTPAGRMALPEVHEQDDGTADIAFPPLTVRFDDPGPERR